MPISASATDARRQSGFTLLEVLVVVTLLALLASLVVPMMGRDTQTDDIDFQAIQLRDRLQQLAENSLFRGEVMAMHLSLTGFTPLRYVVEEQAFVPITDNPFFAEQSLPQDYLLEWTLDTASDRDGRSLADVTKEMLLEEDADDDEETFPQLFFFPSGEATAVSLLLRNSESGEERRLEMDPLGRVTIGEDAFSEDES